MNKIIVTTKCSDCTHKGICKYQEDVNTVNDTENIEKFENELETLPIVLTIVCTEFDRIISNPRCNELYNNFEGK